MRLSPNFELAEFIVSREAASRGIDNTPPPHVIERLRLVAMDLERIRGEALGGAPITITSGYRCPRLNGLVGGAPNSGHMSGDCADFISPQFGSPIDVCNAIIRHGFTFDQLIFEYDWTHFGRAPYDKPRNQILTYQGNGRYDVGIVPKAKAAT